MTYETLKTTLADHVLTLTLHRPERMNAFTMTMATELLRALDEADENDDVRAVIVTGEGRAFCAGMDLEAAGSTFQYASLDEHRDPGGQVVLRAFESKKPLIGAINGAAVGVGVTMTLPFDVRIASSAAKFGFVFARRGITMEAASSWFLPRLVGPSQAMEWVMTGRVFGAEEALAGGLVSRVVPPSELLPAAQALAKECVSNTSGVAVGVSRRLLWSMLGARHPREAHLADSKAIAFMGASADASEGVVSFLEKRPAAFTMSPSKDFPPVEAWIESVKNGK